MNAQTLIELQDPNKIIQSLLDNAPHVISDGAQDYILTEKLFPILNEDFKTRHRLTEEEIENFKRNFDFDAVGIKGEEKKKVENKIDKVKSIDRIISLIEKHIPDDLKKNIVIDHIKRIWLNQNFKNDLNGFISGLNKGYWNLE